MAAPKIQRQSWQPEIRYAPDGVLPRGGNAAWPSGQRPGSGWPANRAAQEAAS